MIDLVLERLGVKAAGVSAQSGDYTMAGEAIDALHRQLRQRGLAPFPTSAFPDEAQTAFADITAQKLLSPFGIGGERAMSVRSDAREGLAELARAYASQKQRPIQGRYF